LERQGIRYYYKNNGGLIKRQLFENYAVLHIIFLNMAGILLVQGTIQYNYGYLGFDNSFDTSVWNDIYCDSTSKKEFRLIW
jgi:hypothetical protein